MPLPRPETYRERSVVIYDDEGNVEGVRKKRYTPVAWDELDDGRLTGDALRLLLLLRRFSDQNETDGGISEPTLRALALERGFGRRRYSSALEVLLGTNTVLRLSGTQRLPLRDANFAAVCFTANERAVRRERWREKKRTQRSEMSLEDHR